MNLELHGSCNVPIAGYCVETETGLALWGLVGDAASGRLIRADAHGAIDDPQGLGRGVAALLRERGADAILAAHV
jgi:hydroxymethylbilane synthase